MSDVGNLQIETAAPMADTACGVSLEVPDMDEGPRAETCNASEELGDCGRVFVVSEHTEADVPGRLLGVLALLSMLRNSDNNGAVPRLAGNLADEIDEFIAGVRQYFKNILGRELPADGENAYSQLYPVWNTFLHQVQGIPATSAIISPDIQGDSDEFITWWEVVEGAQWTEEDTEWIKGWLARWNMFLQARAGETLVTRCSVYLTIVGFILYIVDLGSDIGTAMYYLHDGQWWQAIVTLAFVYGAVIYYTGWKWINGPTPCTGAAARLRYLGSLLVNWPDVQQYGALCVLEWQLYQSPAGRAQLVPEWHQRRRSVALLKFMEGVCEACPQAVLQLCLLVPDLYGAWTWTDYLRIAGASVSLCTAGAALVNREKYWRLDNCTDVPPRELAVLYVWAGPVTVARLMSVALLLTVHPYWALAGVALHLVLSGVHWCRTEGRPRTLAGVIDISLYTLRFCISPFAAANSVTARRVRHAVHFLGNTAVTVVWALGTPLASAQPALYAAILCCSAAMFAVGVVAMELHWRYWPQSYPKQTG